MKIALQANVEGSHDILLKPAIRKKDENGNWKIARKDHCKMLTIPGRAGDRRLIVSEANALALGVGSVPEFWKFLLAHKGPGNGDFRFTRVLDDFKFRPAETMSYDELFEEIEKRTGTRPAKQDLTKPMAIKALRSLRHLAEQDEAPVPAEAAV